MAEQAYETDADREARITAALAEVDAALGVLDAATDRYRDALDALAAAEATRAEDRR